MKTIRFTMNVKAVDCYIYAGYMFLALENGDFGYIPMSAILHCLKEQYPHFQSLLRLAFERNDYFSNHTGQTFWGITEVMVALKKLWYEVSENVDFVIDFDDVADAFVVIDEIPSYPILDIKMYAMTMFVGCKDGLFESSLGQRDNKYSIEPKKFQKKFDAKVVGLNASCGSVVVSAGQEGLFNAPFDIDTGVRVDEEPVQNVSYRTAWSAHDIVNYSSSSHFDYLTSLLGKNEDRPLRSKFDERTERLKIVKLCDKKIDMNRLFSVNQIALDDIVYAFNSSNSSFILSYDGFYHMNFVKTDKESVHLSSRKNELVLFDRKRKFEKPISASVVPGGCVLEFFDSVVIIQGGEVIDLEQEPVYGVRTYMNSLRYRNLISITKTNAVTVHSIAPFGTYNYDRQNGAFGYVGNNHYEFKTNSIDELPF